MARSIQNRNFLNTACATAALAFAGPFALVGVYAAGVSTHASSAHVVKSAQPGSNVSRTRTVAAVPLTSDSQPATIDDLMTAVPDPSTLSAASAAQSQSAQTTIVAQLDAFKSGNFEQADTYQSKSLRASFPSTQQFRIAMSEVYPEFTAYKSVQFGMTRADKSGRFVLVPTTLTGQDGVTVHALYVMVRRDTDGVMTKPYATDTSTAAQVAAGKYQVMTVLGGMDPRPIVDTGMDYQVT